MASGDLVKQNISEEDLPVGHVLTASGRISAVHQIGSLNSQELPFSTAELLQLDETLALATRSTRIRFNVYVGDLGSETAAGADALFPTTPDANTSVLVAVSPNERAIEVRSGRNAHVSDRVAQLGITAATASFRDGNLIDGLVAAVRVMSAAVIAP
ncbi:hypothetical protein GCM10007304_15000 [Rhodococcoides trifolii]|uniref:DUF5130 domain-containing protein n=1 Tax=Rhodococcoides trifolii TaxID=908250 RepID=A0A917CYA7_9NOCA|nr:DUF5130 family protein [Rhodococcus trifolii]GGG02033.1 hypothetical protein GCM10007304_15000 [Rhodococcus trifolii]